MARALMFASCVAVCLAAGAGVGYAQIAHSALSEPFRDLGIMRDQIPAALERAVAAPYALPGAANAAGPDCIAIVSEITALDTELGPDVDVPPERRTARGAAGNLLSGAVRSALHLPYRGVVRRITGAERRDQAMQQAVNAGMARRAFLKGLRETQCRATPLQEASTQVDALDAPVALAVAEPAPVEQTPAPVQTASVTQTTALAVTPVSDTVAAAR